MHKITFEFAGETGGALATEVREFFAELTGVRRASIDGPPPTQDLPSKQLGLPLAAAGPGKVEKPKPAEAVPAPVQAEKPNAAEAPVQAEKPKAAEAAKVQATVEKVSGFELNRAAKTIDGKTIDEMHHKTLSKVAKAFGLVLVGMNATQARSAVDSKVFGDGTEADAIRQQVDQKRAEDRAEAAAKKAEAEAEAAAEAKSGRAVSSADGLPVDDIEAAASGEEPVEELDEQEDVEQVELEDDDFFSDGGAPQEKAGPTIDPNDIPDFIKTSPKLVTIVHGIQAKHKTSDPEEIVSLLDQYKPFSPKIQQHADSINASRIRGILAMTKG